MYIVTGGAGFIGSNIAAALTERGEEVVVCDWMRADQRWRNIAKHDVVALIAPRNLLAWLSGRSDRIKAIVHMGAIATTTESDVELIAENNIRFTLDLLEWCTKTQTRLIYASSAATYGDGSKGFDDEISWAFLAHLKPLNAYGWSKHFVDRKMARLLRDGSAVPPQWVGLKFFNVYGPNEYHKESMQSVVARSYASLRAGNPLSLFRSYRSDYPDGGQARDFVYVGDCVNVVLWFLDNSHLSGLFNVGTGKARTWADLGRAMFSAMKLPEEIHFVDMPESLRDAYQYFTEARVERLRSAGYTFPFTTLEDGINEYVRKYLDTNDPYR